MAAELFFVFQPRRPCPSTFPRRLLWLLMINAPPRTGHLLWLIIIKNPSQELEILS